MHQHDDRQGLLAADQLNQHADDNQHQNQDALYLAQVSAYLEQQHTALADEIRGQEERGIGHDENHEEHEQYQENKTFRDFLAAYKDYDPNAALKEEEGVYINAETAGEKTKRRLLKGLGWGGLIVFALIQGLGAGANNAASIMKSLPSIATLSLPAAQVVVTSLGIAGALMNFYIMLRLLPGTCGMLWKFFKNLKKDWMAEDLEQRKINRRRIVAKFGIITLGIFAGIAVGALTFEFAPMTILGMSALFGAGVVAPQLLLAIAITLAVVQAAAIFCLLVTDAFKYIDNFSIPKIKKFFQRSWWPRANDLKHTKQCRHGQQKKITRVVENYRRFIENKYLVDKAELTIQKINNGGLATEISQQIQATEDELANATSKWQKLNLHFTLRKLRSDLAQLNTEQGKQKRIAELQRDIAGYRDQMAKSRLMHARLQRKSDHHTCHCHSVTYRRLTFITRGVVLALGGVLLLGAAIFGTIVEAGAFHNILTDSFGAADAVAHAFTIGMIYIASGVLNSVLNVAASDSIFGVIGRSIGAGMYRIGQSVAHPMQAWRSFSSWISVNAREAWQFAKANPKEAVWTGVKVTFGTILGVYFIAKLIGNTIGNASLNSHAIEIPNHKYNENAAVVGDAMKPDSYNAERIREMLTTPQAGSPHAAHLGAAAAGGIVSATLMGHIESAAHQPKDAKQMKLYASQNEQGKWSRVGLFRKQAEQNDVAPVPAAPQLGNPDANAVLAVV